MTLLFFIQVGLPASGIQQNFWIALSSWIAISLLCLHILWKWDRTAKARNILKVCISLVFLACIAGMIGPLLKHQYERENPARVTLSQANNAVQRARDDARKAMARFMGSKLYSDFLAAHQHVLETTHNLERAKGCLIDASTHSCYPEVPQVIDGRFSIKVDWAYVAEEAGLSDMWITAGSKRSRIQLAMYITARNSSSNPDRIRHIAIEWLSDNGWRQLKKSGDRMIGKRVLAFSDRSGSPDDAYRVVGVDLDRTVAERTIEPGTEIGGWVCANFPANVARGENLGRIRVSIQSVRGDWIGELATNVQTVPGSVEVLKDTLMFLEMYMVVP